MSTERLELPQGTLDLLLLKVLSLHPMHGWAISERLRQVSKAMLQIPQGSIYPALHRLERRGWVEAEWGPLRQKSEGEVLPTHETRPKATLGRVRGVGAPHDGGWIRPRHEVAESAMVREFWNDIRC